MAKTRSSRLQKPSVPFQWRPNPSGVPQGGRPAGLSAARQAGRAALRGILLAMLVGLASAWNASAATQSWLRHYGLQPWESVLDHDLDGFLAEEEFQYGTDPFNPQSHPLRFVPDATGSDGTIFQIQIATGVSYGEANLQTSTNLLEWLPVSGFPPPAPATFTLAIDPEDDVRFFRFFASGLADSDGDRLLDFEELNLCFTDPLKADTDGDGLDDYAEVMIYHTDPNRGSPGGRGAVSGRVVLDEDRDPTTQDHPGLAGWMVYLDLDFDGEPDPTEPSALSQADGRYVIAELDPGFYRVSLAPRLVWTQIFPTSTPVPVPDGYPDRVVEVFDSGTGPIPFPYGRYVDPLPGLRLVFPSPAPVPVEASVVLGALPPPPIAGPFGGWAHVDILSVPTNSFVTVAFDGEEIVDGPGPDLVIWCAAGAGADSAEVYLGSTATNLVSAGVFTQDETIPIDLASAGLTSPVRYVKVRGLGLFGTYPGIDLVGFEALHYRPLTRGHYDVTVAAGQTVPGLNFGVAGDDRPPKIFISTQPPDIRAGQSLSAQVTATDDLGLTAVQLSANGAPVPLDAQGQAVVTVAGGGLLTLAATATDTANQSSRALRMLIARNEDGSLPDLSGLSVTGGGGGEAGPSIQVHSPVAGEILSAPRAVLGTVLGTTDELASWQVHYAPADLVNPRALDAPDPDYVLLSEGVAPVINGSLGALAGDTLPAGAYLLRVSATDIHGTTRYLGFVFGVRIEPLDLRPEIALTAPANESTVTHLTDLRGSIRSRQLLRDWYVEYAPLSQVSLQNLADNTPAWVRLASGTNTLEEAVLATFDPTLLPNDSYVLRLSAWNENGLGWTESLVVQVIGEAKLGNFAVEFADLNLPLAGIPITVKRVYDSLRASRSGDFGYGWRLALQEADLAETVPQTGSGFASTPFKVGTRVYLTAPDGKRIGFTFQPEVGAGSLFGAAYRAVFKPDPGVPFTLSVPEGESPFLSLNSAGEVALFFIPLPWNPDTYLLTDRQGTRYTYDQQEGLLEIQDAGGNRVTFSDEAITHSAGPRVQFTRDASGRITQMLAPDGQSWRYQYDLQGDLVQVTYPGGLVATLGYATTHPHFLETINDPWRGPASRTEYNDAGRVIAVIDAAGNRHEQNWDPGTFAGTLTDARGNVTRLTYDRRGNVIRSEDPLGGISTWEFKDPVHPDLPTAWVNARSNRTTYKYDAAGNLLEEGRPLARTLNTYDATNRLTRRQYGTGGVETFTYDARGNLLTSVSQVGNLEFTYTEGGLLASLLDGEGGLTRLEYDGALRFPSRIILPDGAVKQFAYDAAGRLVQFTDPSGGVTRQEYDVAGRLVRVIDPAGAETRTTYDLVFPHRPATVTDRAGGITRHAYDVLGRLVQVTAPGGAVTHYEYDADGNRTALVDPLGNRFEFRYDALNHLIEETDPEGHRRLHSYDVAGNRIATTDRNGRRRAFTYDAHHRVQEERWLQADDQVLRSMVYTYDRLDQLTTVSDPDAALTLGRMYVPNGPLLFEEARYVGAPVRRIAFSYDAATRRDGVNVTTTAPTLEPALAVDYTRDLAGHLRIVSSRNPLPPSTLRGLAFQLQLWRNPRGDLAELRRFADLDGKKPVSQSFFYYSDFCGCRLDRLEHVASTNQPLPEATQVFTRDPAGQIIARQDGPDALIYAHDAAGQLTSVTRNGATAESYSYDANGNRRASHRHADHTTGPGNRLTRASPWNLAYDFEGNLVTKSNTLTGVVFTFTWDHRNRLTRVQQDDPAALGSPSVTEYRYDPFDRRIAVIRDGRTTWTYYDGRQPLVDFVDADTTAAAIQFSGEKLDDLYAVWRRGEGLFWTLTDPLGTPRWLLDTNGVPVAAYDYDSYGNQLAATGTHSLAIGRFGFTGREWDGNTGLYYYRARYYDPELGRFISEDPVGFGSGEANHYRYARNSPVRYRDPTGTVTAPEYAFLTVVLAGVGEVELIVADICAGGTAGGLVGAPFALVPSGGAVGGAVLGSAAPAGLVAASPFLVAGAAGVAIAGTLQILANCF